MMKSVHTRYREEFRGREPSLPGAQVSWVRKLRERALEIFLERGFPDTRIESWKYTDLRALERHHFSTLPRVREIDEEALQARLQTGKRLNRLVFIDGHHAPELDAFGAPPDGLTVSSLAFTLVNRPQELEGWLGKNTELEKPGFNAFNTAFMSDGAWIHLSPGTVLEQPLHLLYISTGKPEAASVLRNVIVAGPGSRAQIVESCVSLNGADSLTSLVTEIFLGDGAGIEHCKLEQESESAFHMAGVSVNQQRQSHYTSHNITLGGRLANSDCQVMLDGPEAACTLNGLYLTRGRQHVDNRLCVEHRRPHTRSRQWYKGVLDERSRAAFTGRVLVHRDAQHTDAAQGNHNLLLSSEAEADARPQLEIHADDVKCSHGCTVGRLDENALFYLRSRAIDAATARNFLILAFSADVLQRLRITPVRRSIGELLARRLQVDADLYQNLAEIDQPPAGIAS